MAVSWLLRCVNGKTDVRRRAYSQVSTGWRTASTVIIIIVGAVLITFAVFIYRRRKTWREGSNAPEMQQRYMDSFAGDPEAHTPLLVPPDGAGMPPIPPKTAPFAHNRSTSSLGGLTHHRNGSSIGGLGELGDAGRSRPSRVLSLPCFPSHLWSVITGPLSMTIPSRLPSRSQSPNLHLLASPHCFRSPRSSSLGFKSSLMARRAVFHLFGLSFNANQTRSSLLQGLRTRTYPRKTHQDRKSTRLNSSHSGESRMPSSA